LIFFEQCHHFVLFGLEIGHFVSHAPHLPLRIVRPRLVFPCLFLQQSHILHQFRHSLLITTIFLRLGFFFIEHFFEREIFPLHLFDFCVFISQRILDLS